MQPYSLVLVNASHDFVWSSECYKLLESRIRLPRKVLGMSYENKKKNSLRHKKILEEWNALIA